MIDTASSLNIKPASASVVTSSQRQTFADELRGFALLGIVLVNAPFLGISSQGFTEASVAAWYDRLAAMGVIAFAQAKFYVLFSFLFGYSLHFIVKSDAPDASRRFKRRLLGLGLLGALHAAFFFVFDILLLYAVLGFALLWLRLKSDRAVLQISATAAALWIALLGTAALLTWLAPAAPGEDPALALTRALDSSLANGSFWQAAVARLEFWPLAFTMIGYLNGLGVLAMFGLGLVAGRQNLLADPQVHTKLWRAGLFWGWGLGLPMGVASAWLLVGPGASVASFGLRQTLGVIIGFAGAPLLTWGYVSVLAQLHIRSSRCMPFFRPAGRMSLTGYIGESVLLSSIFCGYGFGWLGQLGAAAITTCALGVWLALDVFAHWVQKRWKSGPLESVLRRFSGA